MAVYVKGTEVPRQFKLRGNLRKANLDGKITLQEWFRDLRCQRLGWLIQVALTLFRITRVSIENLRRYIKKWFLTLRFQWLFVILLVQDSRGQQKCYMSWFPSFLRALLSSFDNIEQPKCNPYHNSQLKRACGVVGNIEFTGGSTAADNTVDGAVKSRRG